MLQKFLKDESGATAIEYVLLAALIGVAIIGAATAVGNNLDAKLNEVNDALEGAAVNTGS